MHNSRIFFNFAAERIDDDGKKRFFDCGTNEWLRQDDDCQRTDGVVHQTRI